MQKEAGLSKWWWVVVVSFSFVIGYLMASDSSEVKKLRAELAQLKQNDAHPPDLRVRAHAVAPKTVSARQPLNTNGNSLTLDYLKTGGEIALRRQQGEYFLQSESPSFRKGFEQAMSNRFSIALSNNMVAYSSVFSKFGLDPTVSAQLEAHLAKLNVASLEAGQYMTDLMMARNDYDERMRKLLSPEDYASYRQYEESKHANHEYNVLQDYLNKNNLGAIDPAYRDTLVKLIQNSQAYVTLGFQGPYDPLPQAAAGVNYMLPLYQQRATDLASKSAQLLQRAADAGLPQESVNLLNSYYQSEIQGYQNSIAAFQRWQQNPEEESAKLKATAQAIHQQIVQKQQQAQQGSPPPQ